jgi:DNA polymerase III alpha subunit
MFYPCSSMSASPSDPWPRPPSCLPCGRLEEPPQNARVAVAGLVLIRQRPGTAKGVIFVTLEDETGICNVIVWRRVYETFRRAVIAGRALRVTGRIQRGGGVTHLIAERIEDISPLLDELIRPQDARL